MTAGQVTKCALRITAVTSGQELSGTTLSFAGNGVALRMTRFQHSVQWMVGALLQPLSTPAPANNADAEGTSRLAQVVSAPAAAGRGLWTRSPG